MKIVLVGGEGFIGQYLNKLLIKNKNSNVVVLDRDNFTEKEIYLDSDVVVILTPPSQKIINNITSILATSKFSKKVIYLSTLLLYPDSFKKNSEKVLPNPKTSYEKNKYKEELLLTKVTHKVGFNLCIVRLANVYGDIKNKGIISNIFLSALKKNGDLTIHGDPAVKVRDYLFIEDAVNLLEFLIYYKQNNQVEVFNICTGKGHRVDELITLAESIIGKKIPFKIEKAVLEKRLSIGDNDKILSTSHYRLKYDLASGFKKTYSNYLKTI